MELRTPGENRCAGTRPREIVVRVRYKRPNAVGEVEQRGTVV